MDALYPPCIKFRFIPLPMFVVVMSSKVETELHSEPRDITDDAGQLAISLEIGNSGHLNLYQAKAVI